MSAGEGDTERTTLRETGGRAALTGDDLRAMFHAASQRLLQNADAINAINVFPVPDGDTGSNMSATLRDSVAALPAESLAAGDLCAALARNALMAARGNSGVILSQILRGFARAAAGSERLDGRAIANALAEGSRTAFASLERPLEGTILTVVNAAAEAAQRAGAGSPDEVLSAALEGARAGLARTPELLPVLKQAGVVDSGGLGLVVLLDGAVRSLRGEPEPGLQVAAGSIDADWLANTAHEQMDGSTYGYCTEFVVLGVDINVPVLRNRISVLGDSVVIAADATATHIHVHSDDPGAVISLGTALGRLARVKVENMQLQHEALVQSLARSGADEGSVAKNGVAEPETQKIAVIFVVSGEGLAETARSVGATAIVAGGQTMNPSVQEILAAIEVSASPVAIVLPNNKNVLLTAGQAAEVAHKAVRVVPTRSVPAGIAALLAFCSDTGLDENAAAMTRAAGLVRTVEVTRAARATRIGEADVAEGQPIGLIDDVPAVAADTCAAALIAALEQIEPEAGAVVTLYTGGGVANGEADEAAARVAHRFPDVELQTVNGGQPHYPFIASVE